MPALPLYPPRTDNDDAKPVFLVDEGLGDADSPLVVEGIGLASDGSATAGSVGSLNAKMRFVTNILNTIANSLAGVLSFIFPVRSWTDISPVTLSTGAGTEIIASASGSNLNILSDIGFQNVTSSAVDLTLKKGGVTFGQYSIPANGTLSVGWEESREWRFAGAFTAIASASNAIKVTHGRYRVGTA